MPEPLAASPTPSARPLSDSRRILTLAVPAFLALIAEPLFLLADAAIVGHLGTRQLAGLGLAGVVLQTAVAMCVFLAYGTTASVARLLGAGDRRRALAQGIDGIWLAVAIGLTLTLVMVPLAERSVALFGADPDTTAYGATYLRIAALGITPLLIMLATTGILRGLQDTRTPLAVAILANVLNVVLNVLLVYGAGPVPALGLAGSAWGSVIAQLLAALALLSVVVRTARREGSSLVPDLPGIKAAATASVPLLIRTLAMRVALLIGTYAVTLSVADDLTATAVATHQIAITLWGLMAYALDAIAIAAQAIIGHALGAGDRQATRRLTTLMIRWGAWSGVVTGLVLALSGPVLGPAFTQDPAVRELLIPTLLVAALGQPLAGVVFVLDGVLIGAGDTTYLAWASVITTAIYAPLVLALAVGPGGLPWVWVAMILGFIGTRWVLLTRRARTDVWMV